MDSSVSSRQKEIREISSPSLMLSLKWSGMSRNQSSSNLTSPSISLCPGGAWARRGGRNPFRWCESAKFYLCASCGGASKHPQSDKTHMHRSESRSLDFNKGKHRSNVKTQHKSGPLLSHKQTWKQPLMPSSGPEERIQFINCTVCQHGRCKHTLPLVSFEIDSVYSNSFLPCPKFATWGKIW